MLRSVISLEQQSDALQQPPPRPSVQKWENTLGWMDGCKPRLKVTLPSYQRAKNSHKCGNTPLGVLCKFSIAINRRVMGPQQSWSSFTHLFLLFFFFTSLIGAKANSRLPIKRFEPRGDTELLIYQGEADGGFNQRQDLHNDLGLVV